MKKLRKKIFAHVQKSSQKFVSFGDGQSDKCPGKNIFPAKIPFAELFLDTSRIPVLIPSCGGKRNWEQWEVEMKSGWQWKFSYAPNKLLLLYAVRKIIKILL